MTGSNRPCWNVYRYDFNSGKIEQFNIFNNWKFYRDTQENYRKYTDMREFGEQLRRDLMYYYWSKCEHEIIVSSWPYADKAAEKIDIYQQVMLNWNAFLNYVWEQMYETNAANQLQQARRQD